jgi:predicted O-linked N-acetylglucosamine transferase (SPINDLY family)
VQVTSIGHNATSGVPTIDYYISSRLYEPPDAQQNYSERLVLLDNLVTYYQEVNFPDVPFKTRAELGISIPDDAVLFGCMQSHQKLSIPFLKCVRQILDAVPNSYVIMFEKQLEVSDMITDILGHEHVIWTTNGKKIHEVRNYIAVSDVLLCPFPFGGLCTTFDAFYVNKPIVTLEGNLLMGRFTYGLYKRIGFMDCVATTPEEYVDIAVRLVKKAAFYNAARYAIMSNKDRLFECKESLEEWYRCLCNL